MRILIIGADSFIAQQLINILPQNDVKAISRVKTSFSNEKIITNLFQLDINNFSDCDIVLNFAAIVHQPKIKDDSIYKKINTELPIHLATRAKKAGVRLFIQMSTIAVYGNAPEISIITPYNPINSYGLSKLNADKALITLQDANFNVAIVRPPMVYGGGKAPGNMMRLIKLVDKKIPLPFKGIKNHRDFINVKNLVQYLKLIIDKQLKGIHLITDNEPVSTEYLIQIINKYLNKKGLLIKVPTIILKILKTTRPKEFFKLYGELRIQSNFQYNSQIEKYSVEQGIKEMIEWHLKKKQYKIK